MRGERGDLHFSISATVAWKSLNCSNAGTQRTLGRCLDYCSSTWCGWLLRVPIRRIEEYSSIFVKERLVIAKFVCNVLIITGCYSQRPYLNGNPLTSERYKQISRSQEISQFRSLFFLLGTLRSVLPASPVWTESSSPDGFRWWRIVIPWLWKVEEIYRRSV